MKLFIGAIALLTIGGQPPQPAPPATCTPLDKGVCTACSNCSSCKNCSKQGGACTVCAGSPPPSRPPTKPPANPPQTPEPSKSITVPATLFIPFVGRVEPERHLVNPERSREHFYGRVVAISDGDTITVLSNDYDQFKVRLHGIDAPEKKQAFGNRAKQHISDLVFGEQVRVTKLDIDRYRRIVARISHEGKDINIAMVEAGYAWWYVKYAPNDLDLEKAEVIAREYRRGLWQDANPTPPWEWRGLEVITLTPCCR